MIENPPQASLPRLFHQAIKLFRDFKVQIRHSTFAVGGEHDADFAFANIDIWNVVIFHGNFRHRIDKVDTLLKIVELKGPLNVLFFMLPLGKLFDPFLDVSRVEKVGHRCFLVGVVL